MSALRVPGPDGHIRLIDQGPGVGRISFSRYATRGASIARRMLGTTGGKIVETESTTDRDSRSKREAKARWRASQTKS